MNVQEGKYDPLIKDGENRHKLTGMFKDWFLDYASYVILERAVPHISDGLKPVQRRILHAMKGIDDGRYNKVANIIGQTMQYHPHGDASIGDALVQMGQKNILIDCQGNWGNILTGDSAAAPRYIEARLSKFANEVVFNPKTTEWMSSYDGRNEEPVNLPVKFPLLLAQGADGIAVGLASKILPHNFNELIDASVKYLKGEKFQLYPDFPTGGLADCSRYRNGIRGGVVKIRAKIEKRDKKTLVITEIPYGKTTTAVIDSIIKANDKGKIKIRNVSDNTAQNVEIVITLHNDVSPDKTIDALYAFTDCEVSISPNTCVIKDKRPCFIGVDEILKYNTDKTESLLKQELEIKLEELNTGWHYLSLEKIFFENRVYRILEDNAKSWEAQLDEVFKKMAEYESLLRHPIEKEDILKLVEKPVRKISKFDVKDITNKISSIEKEIEKTEYDLRHIIEYTIAYYGDLKQRYGSKYPRLTALGDFETISATKVVATNAKLYVNRDEGFIGTDLKKDDKAEYLCECSDIDDVIIFLKNGLYKVTKVSEKAFVGKDIIYAGIYIKNDKRTIYNAVYKDGKRGFNYVKRFSVPSVTRDKEYDLTKGSPDSRILWFSANPNGEAEVIKVFIRPRPKLKKLIFEYNFADLAIKGRNSMGNILSRNPLHKIQLKSKGISTIGGKSIWFDTDINRLNEDSHGLFIGEFKDDEQILVICREGKYYTTNYDLSNRYQGSLLKIEKFDGGKVFSAIYFDGASGFYYIKRFRLDISENIVASFISEDANSKLIGLSEDEHPCITIKFGGKNQNRAEEIINAEEFIGIKGFRAKGKRLTTYEVADVSFSTPLETDESEIKKSGDDKQDNIDEQLSEEKETISENDENDSPTLF